MAAVERGDRDLTDYYIAADIAVESGRADVAGPLLGMLLESLTAAEATDEVLDFALNAVLLGIGDPAVRQHAAAIHKKAGKAELPVLLEPIKGSPGETVRERILLCLQLTEGRFVNGTEVVGPERVVKFDTDAGRFHLTDGSSERELTPEEAASELTLLPDDDFRGRLRFDVDTLVAMSKDDPVTLIASALRSSRNRLEWQDMKKLFARGVVAPTAFARWWNKTKGLVERDPMIQVYGEKQPTLILRDEPISHEEELRGKLHLVETPLERIALMLGYLNSIDEGHAPDATMLGEFATELAEVANNPSTPTPIAMVAASVHQSVCEPIEGEPPQTVDYDALMERADDMRDSTTILDDEEYVRRALFCVKEHAPNKWPLLFSRTLPTAPGRLPETLARELVDANRQAELGAAIQAILKTPDRCGEGLLWLFKAAVAKPMENAPESLDPVAITLSMLRLMNRWARAPKSQVTASSKSLLTKMRNAVAANDYKIIHRLMGEVTDVQAKLMFEAVKDNLGLNDANRHHIQTILLASHEEAIMGKKELWEQDAIYVTAIGLRSRQAEFDNIVNVEMVKNSEAIGHAADFGDLSENAEFTAALEQRDFLSRRANEIGAELRKAAIIPDDIDDSTVNVGTKVTVVDQANDDEEVLVFLGPWDVDLDAGIYSYLAPFSRAFMGSKVGDTVTTQTDEGSRELRITAIERAEMST